MELIFVNANNANNADNADNAGEEYNEVEKAEGCFTLEDNWIRNQFLIIIFYINNSTFGD